MKKCLGNLQKFLIFKFDLSTSTFEKLLKLSKDFDTLRVTNIFKISMKEFKEIKYSFWNSARIAGQTIRANLNMVVRQTSQ